MSLPKASDEPRAADDGRVVALAASLAALPVLVDLALDPRYAPFRYSAGDAFYYHVVARNLVLQGAATFDQVHSTNGFHPFWQLLLAALYGATKLFGLDERTYVTLAIVAGAGLVTVAVALAGRALATAGRVSPLFLLTAVGPYALVMTPIWLLAIDGVGLRNPFEGRDPLYGTLWSFANGMESGLSLTLFAALLPGARGRPASRSGVLSGLGLGALVLARLDLIFVAAVVVLAQTVRAGRRRDPIAIASALASGFTVVAVVGVYLCVNHLYAGAWLPVSGARKTTFPHLSGDAFAATVAVLDHPLADFQTFGKLWRSAQIVLPVLLGCLLLRRLMIRRRSEAPFSALDLFLIDSGAGLFLLAAYDFAFVPLIQQGHWYFAVSTFWLSVVAARVTEDWRSTCKRSLAASALVLLVFVTLQVRREYHALYASIYDVSGPAARAHYGASPPRIVEFDDGIIAFSTGFPAMSGYGYTLDADAARRLREAPLGAIALERGYDHLAVATYHRRLHDALVAGEPAPATTITAMTGAPGVEAVPEFVSTTDRLTILRLRERTP